MLIEDSEAHWIGASVLIDNFLTTDPRRDLNLRAPFHIREFRLRRPQAPDSPSLMREHLADFPASGEELIFHGPLGASLRRNNFHRSVGWSKLVAAAGLPAGFHFHDLRHTGNILAAASGASTRELMHRMGHGSMPAALIYQHATSERDREIAAALDARIKREAGEKWPVRGPKNTERGSGTDGACAQGCSDQA
jgi:integrase